jgi:maleylpyruvate isomerase
VNDGTALFLGGIERLSDAQARMPSALLDWTVGQVIGHVAANADALCNLVGWAGTGIETPMSASLEARNAAIAEARNPSAGELISWFTAAGEEFTAQLDEVPVAGARRDLQGGVCPRLRSPGCGPEMWISTPRIWDTASLSRISRRTSSPRL